MKLLKKLILPIVAIVALICSVIGVYRLFPLKYVDHIRQVSEEMNVDPYLVAALIKAESNFDKNAVSDAGAKGVMQLTDETALFCAQKLGLELKEGDLYRPEVSIRLGAYYLKRTLELFDGDETLAVAAYNAGEGRVREWLQNEKYSSDGKSLDTIPYSETKNHVEKIADYKKIYKVLYPNL